MEIETIVIPTAGDLEDLIWQEMRAMRCRGGLELYIDEYTPDGFAIYIDEALEGAVTSYTDAGGVLTPETMFHLVCDVFVHMDNRRVRRDEFVWRDTPVQTRMWSDIMMRFMCGIDGYLLNLVASYAPDEDEPELRPRRC